MKSYPPSDTDIYPDTPELQKYNKEYNTRVVTMEEFRNALKNPPAPLKGGKFSIRD
jgi:hypothetical protein